MDRQQSEPVHLETLKADLVRYESIGIMPGWVSPSARLNPDELTRLGNGLRSAIERARDVTRKLLEDHLAEFNDSPLFCSISLLDPLGQSRRELSITQVLVWLLNPKSNHGFGDLLLKAFLSHFADEFDAARIIRDTNARDISVCAEYSLESQQRADVVITAGDCAVVLEAKINAKEGLHQTSSYADYFGSKFSNTCFIFLAPLGVDAESNEFISLRYLDMCRILIRALPEAAGASGFHYARYFIAGLLKHMCGITPATTVDELLRGDCIKINSLLGESVR